MVTGRENQDARRWRGRQAESQNKSGRLKTFGRKKAQKAQKKKWKRKLKQKLKPACFRLWF
jgi:hypothetical protein